MPAEACFPADDASNIAPGVERAAPDSRPTDAAPAQMRAVTARTSAPPKPDGAPKGRAEDATGVAAEVSAADEQALVLATPAGRRTLWGLYQATVASRGTGASRAASPTRGARQLARLFRGNGGAAASAASVSVSSNGGSGGGSGSGSGGASANDEIAGGAPGGDAGSGDCVEASSDNGSGQSLATGASADLPTEGGGLVARAAPTVEAPEVARARERMARAREVAAQAVARARGRAEEAASQAAAHAVQHEAVAKHVRRRLIVKQTSPLGFPAVAPHAPPGPPATAAAQSDGAPSPVGPSERARAAAGEASTSPPVPKFRRTGDLQGGGSARHRGAPPAAPDAAVDVD